MTQVLLGACSIIQGALPGIIANTPPDFFVSLNRRLESHARLCYDRLSQVVGLKPVMPRGSMYMMIGIDIDRFPGINDDIDFTEKLVCEMSVHCLPGQV
jgi:tyrosine aminotransferase